MKNNDDIGKYIGNFIKWAIAVAVIFGGIYGTGVFKKKSSPVYIPTQSTGYSESDYESPENYGDNGHSADMDNGSSSSGSYSYPTNNTNGYYSNPTYATTSENSPTIETQSAPRTVREECWKCNGNRRIVVERSGVPNFGQETPEQECPECGIHYKPDLTTHTHIDCDICNGNGWIEKTIY